MKLQKIIDFLQSNPGDLHFFEDALEKLSHSRIVEFLKEKGKPTIVGIEDLPQSLATEAAWSAGYQECLDDILNFRDKYLVVNTEKRPSRDPSYGALELALERKFIRQDEVEKFRK